MKRVVRVSLLALALAGVGAAVTAGAQNVRKAPGNAPSKQPHIGMVQDWSSQHVIFSKPKTFDETVAAHFDQARWERLANDPRYVMALTNRFKSEASRASAKNDRTATKKKYTPNPNPAIRDWSNVLGGGANGQGGRAPEGMYPAKYNFDIEAAPDCANDFIVYPTNAAGAAQSGGTSEQWSSSFSGNPANGETVTIGSGSRQVVLVASSTANTGLNFQFSGNNATNATNLRNAVNRWAGQTGFRAEGTGATVTIISNTAGNITNTLVAETLGSFATPTRTDGTNGASTGQPTIIAFNQLYNTTCNMGQVNPGYSTGARTNDNAPNVLWSYTTGAGFITETSPVLSYFDNGKQVAFVQRNNTTNTVQLVLLKGMAGKGTAANPVALTSISPSLYRSSVVGDADCPDGCMTTFTLDAASPANESTYSSPFVDYGADILWVGDGNGRLHKFTGVFKTNKVPTQVTTGGYPVQVAPTGLALSGPSYDFAGNVWIGSESGTVAGVINTTTGNGGKIHRVNVTGTPVVTDSQKLSDVNKPGFREAPILDIGVNRRLYAFSFSTPGTITNPSSCVHQGNPYLFCRAVVQFDITNTLSFVAGTPGLKQEVGLGSISSGGRTLWRGTFDNDFYTTGAGNLYVCGGNPTRTQQTRLYKIPINASGVMQASIQGPQIGVDNDDQDAVFYDCSATTYIKNGADEYIYASISGSGVDLGTPTSTLSGCGNATDTSPLSSCLYAFNLKDLTKHVAATSESWTLTASGRIGNGESMTVVIGGITRTFTATNATGNTCSATGGNFYRGAFGASGATVGGLLRGCLSGNLTGYTVGGSGAVVTITRNATGDAPGTDVAEGLSNVAYVNATGINANNPTLWSAASLPSAALQVYGGTSGIIVDNISATPGASQVYFSHRAAGGNAVQASQSGLN